MSLARSICVLVALGTLMSTPVVAQTALAQAEPEVAPKLDGDADKDGIIDGARTWDAAAAEQEPTPTDGSADADHLIVSIGDSVASGEGNPDAGAGFFRRARWLNGPCHRSMLSGAAQVALQIERGERASAVTFVPLGCSGATIDRGLLGDYGGIAPEPGRTFRPQVDLVNALARRREIDALLLSVGANDLGFSKIVRFCIKLPDCSERRFDPDDPTREADDPTAPSLETWVEGALADLADGYDELDESLGERLPRKRVVAVEYFDSTRGPDGFCPMFANSVTREESEWAHRNVLLPLNEAFAAAALRHGWTFVSGVAEEFAEHGLCARGDRWVVTPVGSLSRHDELTGARLAGTLHPNEAGHLATARLIRPALAGVLGASVDVS
ncbi:MAG: GDSL-type esterase/lipase family protein, partial [Solirubrobacterales bacterium]